MCTPDNRRILQCVQTYVGKDAGIDAEVTDPLPVPDSPLTCSQVLEGFTPSACIDVVQLK